MGEIAEGADDPQRLGDRHAVEDALQLAPRDPEVLEHLGDNYWLLGRRIDAQTQWRMAYPLASGGDLLGKGLALLDALGNGVRTDLNPGLIPVFADADTGYGGLLNVQRTVRGYEAAGVAAIQIEDQEFPKKCGHTPGRRVIPMQDMVRKIQVAVEARRSRDFLIIARTDARTSLGLDEALRRAEAYAKAGADILFVESPESEEEMRRIASTLDKPLLANMVEGGRTPVPGSGVVSPKEQRPNSMRAAPRRHGEGTARDDAEPTLGHLGRHGGRRDDGLADHRVRDGRLHGDGLHRGCDRLEVGQESGIEGAHTARSAVS